MFKWVSVIGHRYFCFKDYSSQGYHAYISSVATVACILNTGACCLSFKVCDPNA